MSLTICLIATCSSAVGVGDDTGLLAEAYVFSLSVARAAGSYLGPTEVGWSRTNIATSECNPNQHGHAHERGKRPHRYLAHVATDRPHAAIVDVALRVRNGSRLCENSVLKRNRRKSLRYQRGYNAMTQSADERMPFGARRCPGFQTLPRFHTASVESRRWCHDTSGRAGDGRVASGSCGQTVAALPTLSRRPSAVTAQATTPMSSPFRRGSNQEP